MGLEKTEYYRSDLLSVRYVACRAATKGMSDVENVDADVVLLPLRGAFVEHFSRNREVFAEPNIALILTAGSSYRVSHPVFSYDDCLVIELTTTCFRDVLETVRPPEIPFTGAHSLLAPSAMASRNLLWHRLAHRIAGPLEVEETGVHVLSHILRYSREIRGFVRGSRIPGQIEMAKAVLLSHPERNWSLASLARAVECSPFHLTRMFREHVGVPLHRYQLHTRLAAAMDFLLETDRDLTTIALDLGFSSHSHFTASFKRLTGFTPGHMREAANSRIAAETRKILIAPLF